MNRGRVGRMLDLSAFMKYPRTDTLVAILVKSHWLGFFSLVDAGHACRRGSLSSFEKVQQHQQPRVQG